jgi:HAMP domain-containing protein/HPt (histidine-containing phosphotransfer) domain-containing protein
MSREGESVAERAEEDGVPSSSLSELLDPVVPRVVERARSASTASASAQLGRPARSDLGRRKWRSGVGIQLALLISGIQVALVACLALYFQSRQVAAMGGELRAKAGTYIQLVAAQVRSAVAFDDRETVRELFDALSRDPDLVSAVLYDGRGRDLHAWGTPSAVAESTRRGVQTSRVFELRDRFLAVAPVQSLEGPRGTLILEYGKATLIQSRHEVQRAALLAAGGALCVGVCLAWWIAHSLTRRLRSMAAIAERVAGGDLTHVELPDGRADEIGSLSRSFAAMLTQIKRLFAEIQASAAEEQSRLAGLVRERTLALEGRNADLRRVLDNVEQGFLTIDRAGMMSNERSAIIESWLGPAPRSGSFWEYVDLAAPGIAAQLEAAWEQVLSGFLPLELALAQMPQRFSRGGQHFAFDYKPILVEHDQFERAVVILSDITPIVERERAEAEQRDVLRVFSRLSEDRAGVLEFLAEARRLVTQVTEAEPESLLVTARQLHTLKGNASMFGIERLSTLCHTLEEHLKESQAPLTLGDRRMLRELWMTIHAQVSSLAGESVPHAISIGAREYREFLAGLRAGRARSELQRMVESWQLEATEVRLKRAAHQAAALAQRLGKGPLSVHVESNQLRLDPETWDQFWTEFPHLIRNAVDHGLENPEERSARGKSDAATLCLRTFVDASHFVIEVEDSGRGVDWQKVLERAVARGLPAQTHGDLERALFADGLSTKDRVDETSGRGVGMAAVAAAVEARGGTIQVRSLETGGTLVSMRWPVTAIAQPPATPSQLLALDPGSAAGHLSAGEGHKYVA